MQIMKKFLYLFLLSWAVIAESITHTSASNQDQDNTVEFYLNNTNMHWKSLRKMNRAKRSSAGSCSGNASLFYDQAVRYCCKKCPAGEYVETPCSVPGEEPKCTACGTGTYLEHPNYLSKCRACHYCHIETQSIAKNCSATANTQCKCIEGRYRKEDQCLLCTKCINREILKNCSQNEDTECGQCLPGFYEDQNKCQPCPQSLQPCENQTDVTCTILCSPLHKVSENLYIGCSLIGLLAVLPIVVIFLYCCKRKKESLEEQEIILREPETSVNLLIPNQVGGKPEHSTLSPSSSNDNDGHCRILQKGRTLYDIIDCVPVKRWKEFMRTLELPDKEIEIVEIEYRSFRDQQYEMLRRWCQFNMAAVETIYQALERMNLSGCADELRNKIESYT
ncbi:hypothetical protein XENTR_v10019044 [Xenopus tropicalis]|uniref:TNF receptor superfamily member 25 n=1 Tax=Xenopus tropicalis TaxID=8364 RepID=A0A803KFV1_XENTR|nr:tumor necrosis factor receptor superfamily member 25 [Xenopus tropicalis]KAE8593243.1 hypothetical protein XENTR_v10019044 [Xenopus tropicalis]